MGSGNFFVVLPHPAGGFTCVEAFSSHTAAPTASLSHPRFNSVAAALEVAMRQYSEYGVHVHPDCLTHPVLDTDQDFTSVSTPGVSGAASSTQHTWDHTYDQLAPPTPSWTLHRTEDGSRFSQVVCASCHTDLKPVFDEVLDDQGLWKVLQANDALRLTFSGAYGEFLDTFDGELSAYLCTECAKSLLDAHPWLARLAASALNINVGHVCSDGQLYWVGESSCDRDVDQHGWRRVWVAGGVVFNSEQEAYSVAVDGEVTATIVAHLPYVLPGPTG